MNLTVHGKEVPSQPAALHEPAVTQRWQRKLPVDGLPALWQHAANMNASESQLSFTRAALRSLACQHFLSVTRSFPEDFVERRDVLPAGGKGALHSQFEED